MCSSLSSSSYLSVVSLQPPYSQLPVDKQTELFMKQADDVYQASLQANTASELRDYSTRMQLIVSGLEGLEKEHGVKLISNKHSVSARQSEINKKAQVTAP